MSKLKDIQKGYKDKTHTIKDVVYQCLEKIKVEDERIGAMLGVYDMNFINESISKAESMLSSGNTTNVTGIPIVIKDNINVKGQIASAGSKILEQYISPYDATVIKKLNDAGAIIIGRANMDEFAMGSSTENSAYKKTRNPLDIGLVPGGSSGGSAAAVAAGYVPVSLGSDTGGSVRQPAAFTGLVGLKPTYGAVSRYGLIAMGSSLDQIGPIANNVDDTEMLFDIIKGKDNMDATSHHNISESGRDMKKRIAVPRSFIDQDGVDERIRNDFNKTLLSLTDRGYEVVDVNIKDIEKTLHAYYIICAAEVSSNMGRYDGVRYGKHVEGDTVNISMIESRSHALGAEAKRRIMLGTYVLSSGYYDAYYNKALKLRERIREEIRDIFKDFDIIAMPISPVLPWRFGDKSDPLSAYLTDVFSVSANVIGIPAITVPTGHLDDKIYGSIQMLADWHREDILFAYGKEVEDIYKKAL